MSVRELSNRSSLLREFLKRHVVTPTQIDVVFLRTFSSYSKKGYDLLYCTSQNDFVIIYHRELLYYMHNNSHSIGWLSIGMSDYFNTVTNNLAVMSKKVS